MTAYRQEVRMLEEKFEGFELHHILRHDNEAADALAQLKSNRQQSLLSVFIQYLIKPSIQLDEDNPTPTPGTRLDEANTTPTPGTDPGNSLWPPS
jgi:hypothetical protein